MLFNGYSNYWDLVIDYLQNFQMFIFYKTIYNLIILLQYFSSFHKCSYNIFVIF